MGHDVRPGCEDEASPGEGAFRADLARFYRICLATEAPAVRQRLRLYLTHFGLHCVAAYRYDRWARRLGKRHAVLARPLVILAGVLGLLVELVHHVRIYADVGPGFFIGHAGMIFIGPTRIGRNFSVTHNVTIGLGQGEGAAGFPVIGDDVWVGTASVLSGAIKVGPSATVANGTMLSRSVPGRVLVAGNPGRVVLQGYDNARLMGVAHAPDRPAAVALEALPAQDVPPRPADGALALLRG